MEQWADFCCAAESTSGRLAIDRTNQTALTSDNGKGAGLITEPTLKVTERDV